MKASSYHVSQTLSIIRNWKLDLFKTIGKPRHFLTRTWIPMVSASLSVSILSLVMVRPLFRPLPAVRSVREVTAASDSWKIESWSPYCNDDNIS